MTTGSQHRTATHPIDAFFLDRWSPRAYSGEGISHAELLVLFEAARWAPSASNLQPWRFLYAHRDTTHWPLFLSLLAPANQSWVKNAAVLLVIVSRTTNAEGKSARTHSFDTGAAWENLALEATRRGLPAHGMAGFDYDRARRELGVPDGFAVEAMVAIGRPGKVEDLPPKLQEREKPSPRRPIAESICEGPFAFQS